MFQIIGAMAEFERSLIQERVKAGLRNARAKGRRLGRPRVVVDEAKVQAMRDSGESWRTIAKKLGVGLGTVHRIAQLRSKIVCGDFVNSNGNPEQLMSENLPKFAITGSRERVQFIDELAVQRGSRREHDMGTLTLTHASLRDAAVAWLESRRPYISARTFMDYGGYITILTRYFGDVPH